MVFKYCKYLLFFEDFGDTKIIPGVPLNKLESLIGKAKFLALAGCEAEDKWNTIKDKMYSLTERERQLGLGEKV
jgi:dipeptidyl-peptidase-3